MSEKWQELLQFLLRWLVMIAAGTAGAKYVSSPGGCSPYPFPPSPIPIPLPPPPPTLPPPPSPDTTGKANAYAATVRIRSGSSGCTATIVGPPRPDGTYGLLTAAHCVRGVGSVITLTLKTGESYQAKVFLHDKRADLALAGFIPGKPLPWVTVAPAAPPPNTRVWHRGYGVDRPDNVEEGVMVSAGSASQQSAFRLSVSSGDSGSAIFTEDGDKIISVVCCGDGRTVYGGSWYQLMAFLKPVLPAAEQLIVTYPLILHRL